MKNDINGNRTAHIAELHASIAKSVTLVAGVCESVRLFTRPSSTSTRSARVKADSFLTFFMSSAMGIQSPKAAFPLLGTLPPALVGKKGVCAG